MNDRWQKVERLFDELVHLPEADRAHFLDRNTAEDKALRHELESLLAVDKAAQTFLKSPPALARELRQAITGRFLEGRQVSHYLLDHLVQEGGMGMVFRAHDMRDGSLVAFKLLHPESAAKAGASDQIESEAEALRNINHPSVVRLIEYGQTDGLHYLVMDFVEGETLRATLAKGLPPEKAEDLARQLTPALAAVHNAGLVHADIKPENIMVTPDGRLRVIDFGLAINSGSPASLRETVNALGLAGTIAYSAPERIRGEPASARSDVFAVGCVLFEILTGRPLFQGKTAWAVAETILQKRPAFADLPAAWRRILAKCSDKDPARRFADCDAVEVAIRTATGRRFYWPTTSELLDVASTPAVRRWGVAVMLLVLATGGFAVWRSWRNLPVAGAPGPDSIAVLPFAGIGVDFTNQYLADGLTEEVTDLLARNKGLHVVARSSAMYFGGKAIKIAEVGRKLNVANILQGSVEQAGDRVKVAVRLAHAADGTQIWSNTYERRSSDLFVIQSELAKSIAASLKASAGLSPLPPTHVPLPEAHDAYIRGRYEAQQLTPDSLLRAKADFERAISLDAVYAAPYHGLAMTIANRSRILFIDQTESETKAVQSAETKALQLDPRMASAHANQAITLMQYRWDWAGAETELQQALAAMPNSVTEGYYAVFLSMGGHFSEAEPHLQEALDLDPFGTANLMNLAQVRQLEGRYPESREFYQKALSMAPKSLILRLLIPYTYVEEGHPELALPTYRLLAKQVPMAQIGVALAEARAGQRESALKSLQPFVDQYPNSGVPTDWIARVYAYLGDEANTLKWLSNSADRHEWQALDAAVDPAYEAFHHSPGFIALERRVAPNHSPVL